MHRFVEVRGARGSSEAAMKPSRTRMYTFAQDFQGTDGGHSRSDEAERGSEEAVGVVLLN